MTQISSIQLYYTLLNDSINSKQMEKNQWFLENIQVTSSIYCMLETWALAYVTATEKR